MSTFINRVITHKRKISLFLCGLVMILTCAPTFSAEPTKKLEIELPQKTLLPWIDQYKFSNKFRTNGWKVFSDIYFGEVKVGGKWGIGVIVDKGKYRYGINNKRIAFELTL